jgi:hypothetical protein
MFSLALPGTSRAFRPPQVVEFALRIGVASFCRCFQENLCLAAALGNPISLKVTFRQRNFGSRISALDLCPKCWHIFKRVRIVADLRRPLRARWASAGGLISWRQRFR